MQLLVLTKFDSLGASSRVRCLQYCDLLNDAGVNTTVLPLLTNDLLTDKYKSGSYNKVGLVSAYTQRIKLGLRLKSYDTIWVQKEIFPYMPLLDELFFRFRGKIILDLDDAEFLKYSSGGLFFKSVLGYKYKRLLQRADIVVVGNKYLKDMTLDYNVSEQKIHIIPSVVDTNRYKSKSKNDDQKKITVGWIGTRYTEKYVIPVIRSIMQEDKNDEIEFRLVGASCNRLISPSVSIFPWSYDTEIDLLNTFDVGLMPLVDDQWERGKCGYKAIQYMACGVPVILSPVGVNADIVEQGINGFHAETSDDWYLYIRTLMDNADLRLSMRSANIARVEKYYSINSQIKNLVSLLSLEANN